MSEAVAAFRDLPIRRIRTPVEGWVTFAFRVYESKSVFLAIFSGIAKPKVAPFTSQFLDNYRLKLYIILKHTIKEARISLESFNN